MHILLSNDDGLWAPGIQALANALSAEHRVTVVAPKVEQSAKSSALTIQTPLRAKEMTEEGENPRMIFVDGTPVDCMKFALSYLLVDDQPDLVVSGINHGFNLGSDAIYSGTVGAAMEGLIYGIPSLALSVEKYSPQLMDTILPFILEFIQKIYITKQYRGLLNVNFPKEVSDPWEQVEVVHQGFQEYVNVIDVRRDRSGREYYWIVGDRIHERTSKRTDVEAMEEGAITVVPLSWKQEDTSAIEVIKDLLT